MHTKELKGDDLVSNSTATATAYTAWASDGCSTTFLYRYDKKIKACSWHNVLVVQIESIKSPPAQCASVITRWWCHCVCLYVCSQWRVLIMSILACYCVCCELLLPSTMAGTFTTQWWRQFLVNVGYASIAVYSALLTVYSALSATRVHFRQTRVHCRQWSQRSVTDIPSE